MLVRSQTVFSGFGKPLPRDMIGAKGIQIYTPGGMTWSKKSLIFRNPPYTIEDPTLGQADVRVNFGKLAKSFEGCSGKVDGLPCVAGLIRREVLSGKKSLKSPYALPESEWRSKQKPSFHTLADLEKLIEKKKRELSEKAPSGLAAMRF